MTREQILEEARALDPSERSALAEDLLLSITPQEQAAIDAAWLAEAHRREQAYQRGEMTSSPLSEATERVRSRKRA